MDGATGWLHRSEGRGYTDKHYLSHTSWVCACHAVWIPKCGRKVLYGETGRGMGQMLRALVEHMGSVESETMRGVSKASGYAGRSLIHEGGPATQSSESPS